MGSEKNKQSQVTDTREEMKDADVEVEEIDLLEYDQHIAKLQKDLETIPLSPIKSKSS